LHISFNPTVGDLIRLGDVGVRTEIDNLMKHLGYGNQPYFVYKHADLERVHFHIVSTRIDCSTGKKIKDSYEKEKTQRFIKDLEQKYQLTKDDPQEKINYRFSGSGKNLKQNLESLFGQLNRMEFIASREMYDQALKLFNVEVRKIGRGYSVFVTDENGNPVRHPVQLSDFTERPRFYLSKKQGQKAGLINSFTGAEHLTVRTAVFNSLVRKEIARLLYLNKNESVTKEKKSKLDHKHKKYRKRL